MDIKCELLESDDEFSSLPISDENREQNTIPTQNSKEIYYTAEASPNLSYTHDNQYINSSDYSNLHSIGITITQETDCILEGDFASVTDSPIAMTTTPVDSNSLSENPNFTSNGFEVSHITEDLPDPPEDRDSYSTCEELNSSPLDSETSLLEELEEQLYENCPGSPCNISMSSPLHDVISNDTFNEENGMMNANDHSDALIPKSTIETLRSSIEENVDYSSGEESNPEREVAAISNESFRERNENDREDTSSLPLDVNSSKLQENHANSYEFTSNPQIRSEIDPLSNDITRYRHQYSLEDAAFSTAENQIPDSQALVPRPTIETLRSSIEENVDYSSGEESNHQTEVASILNKIFCERNENEKLDTAMQPTDIASSNSQENTTNPIGLTSNPQIRTEIDPPSNDVTRYQQEYSHEDASFSTTENQIPYSQALVSRPTIETLRSSIEENVDYSSGEESNHLSEVDIINEYEITIERNGDEKEVTPIQPLDIDCFNFHEQLTNSLRSNSNLISEIEPPTDDITRYNSQHSPKDASHSIDNALNSTYSGTIEYLIANIKQENNTLDYELNSPLEELPICLSDEFEKEVEPDLYTQIELMDTKNFDLNITIENLEDPCDALDSSTSSQDYEPEVPVRKPRKKRGPAKRRQLDKTYQPDKMLTRYENSDGSERREEPVRAPKLKTPTQSSVTQSKVKPKPKPIPPKKKPKTMNLNKKLPLPKSIKKRRHSSDEEPIRSKPCGGTMRVFSQKEEPSISEYFDTPYLKKIKLPEPDPELSTVMRIFEEGEFKSMGLHNYSPAEGMRLMNVDILNEVFAQIPCPLNRCLKGKLKLYESSNKSGLQSIFALFCDYCGQVVTKFCTTRKIGLPIKQNIGDSVIIRERSEVNLRSLLGVYATGLTWRGMKKFANILDLPSPVSSAAGTDQDRIEKVVLAEVRDSMLKWSRTIAEREDAVPSVRPGCVEVAVSFDGSWKQRGHYSNVGFAAVIELKSRKVVDYELLNRNCYGCSKWTIEMIERKRSEYDAWWEKHKPNCQSNFSGTSLAMEAEAAVRMWNRSEERGLVYSTFIGDGDGSGYKSVLKSGVYGGEVDIRKEECVGHLQHRLKKHLMKAKKSTKNHTYVQHQLEEHKADRVAHLFAVVVGQHVGKTPQEMSDGLWRMLGHVSEKHDKCPPGKDSYCFYQKSLFRHQNDPSFPAPKHRRCYFSPVDIEKIHEEFETFANVDVCTHLTMGTTQNINESLHSVIWSNCLKTKYASPKIVSTSVGLSVLCFNDGDSALVAVLNALGINPSLNSIKRFVDIDKQRVKHRSLISSTKYKQVRRQRKIESKNREMERRKRDKASSRILYQSEGFGAELNANTANAKKRGTRAKQSGRAAKKGNEDVTQENGNEDLNENDNATKSINPTDDATQLENSIGDATQFENPIGDSTQFENPIDDSTQYMNGNDDSIQSRDTNDNSIHSKNVTGIPAKPQTRKRARKESTSSEEVSESAQEDDVTSNEGSESDGVCEECSNREPAKSAKGKWYWIGCERCEKWFHDSCMNVHLADFGDDEFICRSCST